MVSVSAHCFASGFPIVVLSRRKRSVLLMKQFVFGERSSKVLSVSERNASIRPRAPLLLGADFALSHGILRNFFNFESLPQKASQLRHLRIGRIRSVSEKDSPLDGEGGISCDRTSIPSVRARRPIESCPRVATRWMVFSRIE